MTDTTATYIIKCDDCKIQIGETDSLRESAAGGHCEPCRSATAAVICGHQVRDMHLAAVTSISIRRDAEGMASTVVMLRSGRMRREVAIRYDRRSDTYSVIRATMTGRSAASLVRDEFAGVYTDSIATICEAGGFEGRIA